MGKRMDSSCMWHCAWRVWLLVQRVRIWGCHAGGQYGKYIQTYVIYFSLLISTSQASASSKNIFNNLPDLAPMAADYRDELKRYLATDVENVKDPLMWWYERHDRFPRLSRMARDYLSIPGEWCCSKFDHNLIFFSASTVDVEHVFSQDCLVLSHICNRLSVQSTHACMCVGTWSLLSLIKDSDIRALLGEEVTGGVEDDLAGEWSVIDGPK